MQKTTELTKLCTFCSLFAIRAVSSASNVVYRSSIYLDSTLDFVSCFPKYGF